MRTRDAYKLTMVNVSDIKPEVVPLSQEKKLSDSLFQNPDELDQREEVRLCPANYLGEEYKYIAINGRRRIETIRQRTENQGQVRAIIVKYEGEEMFHKDALIGNSGRPNYAGEAEHINYLFEHGHNYKSICQITGMSLGTVHGRHKLFTHLIPEVFLMLKDGRINYACASECTKLSEKEQGELLQHVDKNEKKLNQKTVSEFLRGKQSERIENQPTLFDIEPKEDDIPTGLFITYDQFVNGPTEIEFLGKIYTISEK